MSVNSSWLVAIQMGASACARRLALFVEVLLVEVLFLLVDELLLRLFLELLLPLVVEVLLRLVLELVLGFELVLGLLLELLLVLGLLVGSALRLRLWLLRRLNVLHLLPELRPCLEAVDLATDDSIGEMDAPGEPLDRALRLDVEGELDVSEAGSQLMEGEHSAGVHSIRHFPLDSKGSVDVGDLELDRPGDAAQLQIHGHVAVVDLLDAVDPVAPLRVVLEPRRECERALDRNGEIDRLLNRDRRVLLRSIPRRGLFFAAAGARL